MNFHRLVRPIPRTALFQLPEHHVWCGSVARGIDGRFHLFYSRWPRAAGFEAWVTHSEVARAVADSPFGPWRHEAVVLPARGTDFWDGSCTHNPCVVVADGSLALFYMGNRGHGSWFDHRNRQRIGLATAPEPEGPWTRREVPLIEVTPNFHDALMCSNPTATKQLDGGGWLMLYKGVGLERELPFGGPVAHLAAFSEKIDGPYRKYEAALFTAEDSDFAAEDPCVWVQDGRYYALVKDMQGAFTRTGTSLALFQSPDGKNWSPNQPAFVHGLSLEWEDGEIQAVQRLERPQVWLSGGRPAALCCAVMFADGTTGNVQIPLQSEEEATPPA